MDNQELDKYIHRFSTEKETKLNIIDHIRIYNYLLELKMYREIGMLDELYKK